MAAFEVIPAIDLRGGNVVRLVRGDFDLETVFSDDPPALAVDFARRGATRLHVVDLDGAREGRPVQRDVIHRMARASGLTIQVGGGIRTLDTARSYLEAGDAAQWVIFGTAALQNPDLVRAACRQWPGRVLVGIDARKGKVAVNGWLEESEASPLDVVLALRDAGVAGVIYTDIARDGTGHGPNVESTAALARAGGLPIIASGGVDSIAHLEQLAEVASDGVCGVVVGKAILSGKMPVEDALSVNRRA